MANAFKLPDLGEGLTEGEVARWLVSPGQEIAEDDPLVEIQTDKATVEIPSPYAGTVLEILVAEGAVAPVGATLVVIGEPGEEVTPAAAAETPAPVAGQRRVAGHAGRAEDGAGARRRPRERRGHRAGRADHGRATCAQPPAEASRARVAGSSCAESAA